MSHKRIILVGPTASGKTHLRKKLEEKGFKCDVSYTTRPMRPGEVDEVHYHFINKETFQHGIKNDWFYEYVEYNGNYYGTGNFEWNEVPLFIMETDGIKHITPEDRKTCFIIYLNIPQIVRQSRMSIERGWDQETIIKRIQTDLEKFKDFKDYDLLITDSNF